MPNNIFFWSVFLCWYFCVVLCSNMKFLRLNLSPILFPVHSTMKCICQIFEYVLSLCLFISMFNNGRQRKQATHKYVPSMWALFSESNDKRRKKKGEGEREREKWEEKTYYNEMKLCFCKQNSYSCKQMISFWMSRAFRIRLYNH